MAKQIKAPAAPAREDPGFFAECFVEGDARTRRLKAIRGRWTGPRSTSRTFRGSLSAGTECRWCGISVDGSNSGTSAPATRTAHKRRRIRRPANHHCRGLARGVRARTTRQSRGCPAPQARLLPQHRHHVARTGGAGDKRTRPYLLFKSFGAFTEGAARLSGVGRRCL